MTLWIDGRKHASEFGEAEFTGKGLDGPIVLKLSRQIVDAKARITARAFAMPEKNWSVPGEPPGPMLRVVPTGGDDE